MSSHSEDERSDRKPPVIARVADMPAGRLQPDKVVTVLCVSGSEADHQSLSHLFQSTKWTLLQCRSRAEAMELLRTRPVPVVICDCALPDGRWKDFLDEFASFPQPPVLIVTSRLADDRLWADVMDSGGYDVLEKPFNHSELVRVVSLAWLAWKDQRHRAEISEKTRAANDC